MPARVLREGILGARTGLGRRPRPGALGFRGERDVDRRPGDFEGLSTSESERCAGSSLSMRSKRGRAEEFNGDGADIMLKTTMIGLCAGLVALLGAPHAALAQDAIAAPAQKRIGSTAKDSMIPSLAVINSRGASLQGATLTMTGVSSNSIVFADRPFRAAGHVLTKHFLKEWDEGSDSFAKDPPNATISVLSGEGDSVEDAVVVLKSPKLEGDKLTFEVSVLEGDLSKAYWTGLALHRLVRSARLRRPGLRRRRRLPRRQHGMALGTLTLLGLPRERLPSASAPPRSERRRLAPTTTPMATAIPIMRRRRPPAATTPIRPATESGRDTRTTKRRNEDENVDLYRRPRRCADARRRRPRRALGACRDVQGGRQAVLRRREARRWQAHGLHQCALQRTFGGLPGRDYPNRGPSKGLQVGYQVVVRRR